MADTNDIIILGTSDRVGDLRFRVSSDELGLLPDGLWNSSPSVDNFTGYYDLPRQVTIGTSFRCPESASRFSPPPFAVAVRNKDHTCRKLLTVTAQKGHHLFSAVSFQADADGVTATVELEGHSDAGQERMFIHLRVTDIEAGQSELEALGAVLARAYPAEHGTCAVADWWRLPIYCGGGSCIALTYHLFGPGPESRCMPMCTQWFFERNLSILEAAGVPLGSIIIDCGWSAGGVWKPRLAQWPDLKGFIAAQHRRGRRVLLWLGLWFTEDLPDRWCVMAPSSIVSSRGTSASRPPLEPGQDHPERLWADAGNPEYLQFVAAQVRDLISPEGYDADGFKLDMLQQTPSEQFGEGCEHWNEPLKRLVPGRGRLSVGSGLWGCELLYNLQKTIYDAAKSVKPDALIDSSTGHPYFQDTFDIMRLHDTCRITADTDVFEVMASRAKLARAALPNHLIDTDNWIHSYYDKWLDYTMNSWKLGTPCLFFTDYFMTSFTDNPTTCPVRFEDLQQLGACWKRVFDL